MRASRWRGSSRWCKRWRRRASRTQWRRGAGEVPSEFAQRAAGGGDLHRRHPLSRPAKLDAMRARIEREAAAICAAAGRGLRGGGGRPLRPRHLRAGAGGAGAGRGGAIGILAPGHDLGGRARRLLGGEGGAGDDGHVPCVDGLRTTRPRRSRRDWAEKGANVLFHAVMETAGIVG